MSGFLCITNLREVLKISKIKNKIVIMGLGKISKEICLNIIKKGSVAYGFTSNRERTYVLRNIGVKIFDIGSFDAVIQNADSLVITAPPDKTGCPIISKHKKSIAHSGVSWIGYVSSTGVYGDYKGKVVNEKSILKSDASSSLSRLKAENIIKNFALKSNKSLCIFRLSGIYGFERNIILQILNDKFVPIYKRNHFFNRIHEADIGRIIGSCAVSRNLEGIINLSDNKPASQIEVAQYAYKLLGKKIPKILNYEEVYKQLSPIRRNFWENSRKIDNSLLKNTFGKMIYITYKEGLLDIHTSYLNNSSFKF